MVFTSALFGGEIARWEAASPRVGAIQLEQVAGSDWRIETIGTRKVARLKPSSDYYTRAAYHLSLPSAPSGKLWLIIEFLDRSYGLITLSQGVPETRQWSVARVNTGRVRRAVFSYDQSPPPQRLRVEGLDYLCAVVLTDQEPPMEQTPLVESAVKFTLHSERVSSAAGDAASPDLVTNVPVGFRNQLPLIRAIGLNGVETYVRWGWVERKPSVYDWSYYDAILNEIEQCGLQWFPMLLAGSGYALPAWLHDSTNNFGFKCLERGLANDTQTIFDPFQAEYASHFIAEFGKHYRNCKSLLGIRLGPSGDCGEAQYSAKGPRYGFRQGHTHNGYWAGDDFTQAAFRDHPKKKYGSVSALNATWGSGYASFGQLSTFLPITAIARRKRLDFADWYVGAMSEWCEQWAVWSRAALLGSSLGGICSIILAWGDPEVFGQAASLSGAFQVENTNFLNQVLRPYQGKAKPIRLYLDSGVVDFTGGDDGQKLTSAVAEEFWRIGWREELIHYVDAKPLTLPEIERTGLRSDKWAEAQTSQHNEFYWRLREWRALTFLFPPAK